ncbi:hypothetical protein GGE65_001299 [Skermanella aerolata]|uniref:caspase family protein n=1 Tax=Skermanella aerolata TaxID=393310 RepID=UPI003D1D2770
MTRAFGFHCAGAAYWGHIAALTVSRAALGRFRSAPPILIGLVPTRPAPTPYDPVRPIPMVSVPARIALMLTALMFLAPAWLSIAKAQSSHHALVIANSAYWNAAELSNPVNDGQDVAAVLRRLGFRVVEGRDLDRASMFSLISTFTRSLPEASIVVFYFAGHGLQIDGRNYLLPVDARIGAPAEIFSSGFEVTGILRGMQGDRRAKIIILDACRNNPWQTELQDGRGILTGATGRRVSVLPGLAQLDGGPDTLIAFATEPNNVAHDGAGRNSPFAEALIRHLPEPNREIREILSQVRRQVIEATNGRQIPWDHSSLTENVYMSAPPLSAADVASSGPFGAIAVSSLYAGRIHTGVTARFDNIDRAVNSALAQCKSKAPSCSLKLIASGSECLAVATDNVSLGIGWSKASTSEAAAANAVSECLRSGGRSCTATTFCNR